MSEQVGADLPEARDGEGQLSKDALRSPARRLIEPGRLAPRLGCQLAANIPLHATAEAGFGGRRYRVYLESASDSVAPEHLRGSWQPGSTKFRRVAGRIASAQACRCCLDKTPGTAPGLQYRIVE